MTVQQYLKKLASEEPTPGGGSAAALSGAVAAGLLAMVSKLSNQHPGAKKVALEAETLLARCRRLAKADEKAYEAVVAAYKLSKKTEKEKTIRAAKIEAALKKATDVPMHSAKACLAVLKLTDNFLEHANQNALSDLGVAALLARAASEGAILNVLTNITLLRDHHFAHNYLRHAEAVVDEGRNRAMRIVKEVQGILRSRLR